MNNNCGRYFKTSKGVRQGDLLSSFLFNITVDTLAKMISTTPKKKLIRGLVPEYVIDGVAILQ